MALRAVAASPFVAGSEPGSVAIDSLGKFAVVANLRSNDVDAYRIDPLTGTLIPS